MPPAVLRSSRESDTSLADVFSVFSNNASSERRPQCLGCSAFRGAAPINVVALRRARLVPGWVTVCGFELRVHHLGIFRPK